MTPARSGTCHPVYRFPESLCGGTRIFFQQTILILFTALRSTVYSLLNAFGNAYERLHRYIPEHTLS